MVGLDPRAPADWCVVLHTDAHAFGLNHGRTTPVSTVLAQGLYGLIVAIG